MTAEELQRALLRVRPGARWVFHHEPVDGAEYVAGSPGLIWLDDVQPAPTAQELDDAQVPLFTDAATVAVQQRLDNFARTRGYDSILSAATYATSSVPTFAAEGQYAVSARDAHWSKCYEIMAEVDAGARPMPASVDEVLAEMPPLAWPA